MNIRLRSSNAVFLHDMAMIPVAWLGSYWFRFNLESIPPYALSQALVYLPFVVVVQTLVFRLFGLYRGVWRFASIPDLVRIVKAVGAGVLIIGVALFLYSRLQGVPRSVLPLFSVILTLLLCGPRFLYRFWKDTRLTERVGPQALIIGAGMAGEMLVRDLLREPDSQYVPVGFVDDDIKKRRREIHGVRVLGTCQKIPRLIERLNIDVVLIAVPSATDRQMQEIVGLCESCEIPFLTLPSVREVLSGRVGQKQLRDVAIEDLLGRASVHLDWANIRNCMDSRSILVTGGGGSIGAELCNQIGQLEVSRLIIFEKSEYNLYRIEAGLRRRFPELELVAVLGDVTDRGAVEHTVRKFRPELIFHVAAYKHVPLLQAQVREAVNNNVLGTRIVAETAIQNQVRNFVYISTDKAVNPTNVMGACKRAAEILCQSFNGLGDTRFITVRFGNVLDSAGSVVPLFREQIRNGGPVTVTDPEITRFFMTIPEACQLIMQAAAVGTGGEIFVLDMGEPVKIGYLAEQMIRLSGKKPGQDIRIEYVGLRPGEKMFEELFHSQEQKTSTGHPKLLLALSRETDRNRVQDVLQRIEVACTVFDEPGLASMLTELVPEYRLNGGTDQ